MRPTKIEAMTMVAIQELRKIFRNMLTSFLRLRPHMRASPPHESRDRVAFIRQLSQHFHTFLTQVIHARSTRRLVASTCKVVLPGEEVSRLAKQLLSSENSARVNWIGDTAPKR